MTRTRLVPGLRAASLAILFAAPASSGAFAQQEPVPGQMQRGVDPYPMKFGGVTTQYDPGKNRSSNIALAAHVPLGMAFTVSDIDIEQELLVMYQDQGLAEKPALLANRGGAYYSEAAAQLIASLNDGAGDIQVVDVRNDGALPDLPVYRGRGGGRGGTESCKRVVVCDEPRTTTY